MILPENVFVIIISFNGEKWLRKNLQSVENSTCPVNIIVLDNNSSDDSIAIVKEFPKVQLIISERNLGFGKANNLAIAQAIEQKCDYVFLLNQDTWIEKDTIEILVNTAKSNPAYGILSPLHFSTDHGKLDKNFETYLSRKISSPIENICEVPFVNAAAWLLPTKLIAKVGFFEPMFSHYGEDRNYAERVIYHNFKIVVVKECKIYHDRIISRNFNKDFTQSKYIILSKVLNINDYLFLGYWNGLVSVFGLPKYFYKSYSLSDVIKMGFGLSFYYLGLLTKVFTIRSKRSGYK